MNNQTEFDLHNWLKSWISSASEQDVRSKFVEVLPYLAEQDVAYLFYHFILKDFPHKQDEKDSLLE